jgi:small subunit ribosomal protein S17
MPRTITGIVSSDKTDKTIVVTVVNRRTHPLYRKQYTVHSKFMAHDPKNEAAVGDKVVITESRPISARKRFILSAIIEKPKLRDDSLAVTKSEDSGKKPVREKPAEEETATTEKPKSKPEPNQAKETES